MVQKIKTDLCSLVRRLGYNITDNGAYVENFPWLMARTSSHNRVDMVNSRSDNIVIVIDIFSKYKGEKEILDIVEDISDHIWELRNDNPNLIYIEQSDLKVLDDLATGPVKKHGVLTYRFLLSNTVEEATTNDTSGN